MSPGGFVFGQLGHSCCNLFGELIGSTRVFGVLPKLTGEAVYSSWRAEAV